MLISFYCNAGQRDGIKKESESVRKELSYALGCQMNGKQEMLLSKISKTTNGILLKSVFEVYKYT